MNTLYNVLTIIFILIVLAGIVITIKGLSTDRRLFRGLTLFMVCILIAKIYPRIIGWIYQDKEMTAEKVFHVINLRTIPEQLFYIAAFLILIITLLGKVKGKDRSS